ncbi:MAG: biopolymer transporter ExbD [Spirochaetales bacterium]|nr:biopolymer transporter ExbD [Spirochaetales bacterium]
MRFRRRLTPEARVDLIPMIDVVFQLVVFFMVTSTFVMGPGIKLALPTSTTTETVVMKDIELLVSITPEEVIYLNRDGYSLEELDGALGNFSAEQREGIESVIIEGDENISYELMIRVLDILRKNGFSNVSLKLREDTVNR